eukprot:1140817-Pelagomonas_calceolata.AAC.1
MGFWRVVGSTRLHNLAAISITVCNGTPSGNKLVGIHNIMGMKFVSKFIGAFVVQSKLFKLVQGMISTAGPTSTQKDGVESHNFFALMSLQGSACCRYAASNCCPGHERVFTVLNFNQVHVPLKMTAAKFAGPLPAWNLDIHFKDKIMMTCLSATHAQDQIIENACFITTSVPHHRTKLHLGMSLVRQSSKSSDKRKEPD